MHGFRTGKGLQWTQTTLIPNGPIVAAAFADTTLGWAAGENNIIQTHTINPPVFVDETISTETSELMNNYPNPFTNRTTLNFKVGASSKPKSLKIYNALGECVVDLTDKLDRTVNETASIVFDAGNLPVGVYFAVLITDAESQVQAVAHIH